MEPLALTVRLRLVPTAENGRQSPIISDYRPTFDLGNRWRGEPMLNDGRIMLLDAESIAPGAEGSARIDPLRSEYWDGVRPGAVLPFSEGSRVVGYATVLEVNWPETLARPVAAFVRQAYDLCAFIEAAESFGLPERLQRARQELLALYAAGADLPHVEPVGTGTSPRVPLPENWCGFEGFDLYWEVFDPYDHEDHEPVVGSLSDDLLDVYRDIRGGLWSWEKNATANAIWEWRFSFESHWGDHAVDALRALHRACGRSAP